MEYDRQRQQRRPEDYTECGNSGEGGEGFEGGDTSTTRTKNIYILPWLLFAATAAATFFLRVGGGSGGGGRYSSGSTTTTVEQRTSSSPSSSPPQLPMPDPTLETPLAGLLAGSSAVDDSGWVTVAEAGNAPGAIAEGDASLEEGGEYDEVMEDDADRAFAELLLSSISSLPLAVTRGHVATGNRESRTLTGTDSGPAPGAGLISGDETDMRSADEIGSRGLKAKRFSHPPEMEVVKTEDTTRKVDSHGVNEAQWGTAEPRSAFEQSPTSRVSVNDSVRCFDDPREPDVHRCRANIYLFGVSKCGEFFALVFFSRFVFVGSGRGARWRSGIVSATEEDCNP